MKGQRHLVCALGELADRAEAEAFASPSIVVVGQMVAERVEGVAPEPADVEMPIPFLAKRYRCGRQSAGQSLNWPADQAIS